ncbi:serpin A3-3-like [Anguilla anguilla]|uniref:serpin A3-3-like n=1 Tax=Anguilla anguilla TaxID=7936 RepID=UPI0015B00834|nr:serpin A3-3-like [Anguilla anguilla]
MGDLSGIHGDLAVDLYRGLAVDRPHENVLFAISSVLAFLSEGSGSQTQKEILSTLGISNRDNANRACSAWRVLVESLSRRGGEIHLATGSSLHVEKTFRLSPKFQNHSRGKWDKPFVRRHTVNWWFRVNGPLAVEVPMMFRDDTEVLKMLYDTNCSFTVVRLPYAGPLAMLLLLPRGEMGQLCLHICLSVTRMKFWLTNLKPGRAEIRLPKFVLRRLYPLQSILKPTAVQTLFTDLVDLSGFFPNRKLGLQAMHEAILEVDETESESQGGKSAMLDFSEPQSIIFDHPFMLLIYHEPTGTILLIGKLTNLAEN